MTTFELSPNSRFSLHDNPNSLPGKCCLCGSVGGDGRKFVDFGFQLDVYGAVYFCTFCVTELAQAIGFVEWTNLNDARNEIKCLAIENEDVKKEFEEYKNAARTVLRDCSCGSRSGTLLDDVASDSNDEVPRKKGKSSAKSGGGEGFSDAIKPISFDLD